MTVRELKEILADVPDDFPVVSARDWREYRSARPDSYLRASPNNVFVMIGCDDYDMYEKQA